MGKPTLGDGVAIDVDRLLVSRLLVQANSGAGKSWTIRRLLEQTHGLVQHVVLDVEGEFHTLREKYEYVLAGAGGDCPADLKSAALLARRLLELNVSAIVDIYELGAQRDRFVALFLDALMNVSRDLWHPCLVIVDEAHMFCPEKGRGNAESSAAVIDLMTRGRKRGFCGVLATQRISKLNKDAAAEANNKLIGRSALDVDMKRAAEDLGFTTRDEMQQLRKLPAGVFYAFGPAISTEVVKVKIGDVKTSHPEAGEAAAPPTAPSASVKKLLAQLADLPREAEEEARTSAELREQIRGLQRDLRAAKSATPAAPKPKIVEREKLVLEPSDVRRIEKSLTRAGELVGQLDAVGGNLNAELDHTRIALQAAVSWLKTKQADAGAEPLFSTDGKHVGTVGPRSAHEKIFPISRPPVGPSGPGIQPARQRILDALAALEAIGVKAAKKSQLALFARTSPTSSSYENNLGALRTAGLLHYPSPGQAALTHAGRERADGGKAPQDNAELYAFVRELVKGAKWRILEVLIAVYPQCITKHDLAVKAGTSPNSSSYDNNLGALRTLGLVAYPESGMVVATELLFPFQ